MSTTPRGTRSRTRVLRRFSSEKPSFDPSVDAVLCDGASLSADEAQWEDVAFASDRDDSGASLLPNTSGAVRRTRVSARRRRRLGNPAAPARRWLPTAAVPTADTYLHSSASPKQPELTQENEKLTTESVRLLETHSTSNIPRDELAESTMQAVSFTTRYILDVVRIGLALLRRPLGFILFLFLLGMIFSMVSHTLRTAFAPLCWLPGISSSLMCRPVWMNLPQQADYSQLAEIQTRAFECLLDETTGGSALSMEVRKAGMATSDLIVLVRDSSLKSRDVLAQLLANFVDDAKKTARRLQNLHAKVGGSVDSIMAVNNHALRTIEEANSKKSILSIDTLLVPWSRSRRTLVASTFSDAMDTLSTHISRLVIEAEANLSNLNDLEERLEAIHELVFRDTDNIKADRDELLAVLWTILGGNKKKLKSFDDHLALLKNLGKYRRRARAHVVAAIQALQSLSADMEELRERVAIPGLVGESIPLEVQMKSIQYSLDRLQENRVRAHKIDQAALRQITGWTDDINEIDA